MSSDAMNQPAAKIQNTYSLLFLRRRYLLPSLGAGLLFFLAAFLVSVRNYLGFPLRVGTIEEKMAYLAGLFQTFLSGEPTYALMVELTALLFGFNVTFFIVALAQRRVRTLGGTTAAIGGMVSSIIGFGCAACGTLLIPALGILATAGLLPFRGLELQALSILLLGFGVVQSTRRIVHPRCAVHTSKVRP